MERCVNALNTEVILIVVASLALGQALLKTGAVSYLADQQQKVAQRLLC
ncbi:MAG: di/tricarboxylate transporter [Psychromonas sp.]